MEGSEFSVFFFILSEISVFSLHGGRFVRVSLFGCKSHIPDGWSKVVSPSCNVKGQLDIEMLGMGQAAGLEVFSEFSKNAKEELQASAS